MVVFPLQTPACPQSFRVSPTWPARRVRLNGGRRDPGDRRDGPFEDALHAGGREIASLHPQERAELLSARLRSSVPPRSRRAQIVGTQRTLCP
jgi:hypothetical protein